TLLEAGAGAYQKFPSRYWLSLGLVQIVSWLLLVRASSSLRSSLGDGENESNPSAAMNHKANEHRPAAVVVVSDAGPTSAQISCRYCGRSNEPESVYCQECGIEIYPRKLERQSSTKLSAARSALHWLLGRRRGLKPMLWLGATVGCSSFAIYGIFGRFLF